MSTAADIEYVGSEESADLGIERLVHIDKQIDENETCALRARWEFGRQMLAARDGMGRLPNNYMRKLVEHTGKSRRELAYRAQFAETFPTEQELCTAVHSFDSWTDLRSSLKQSKDAENNLPVEPPSVPDGLFSTFVVDPPWQYGNTSTRGAAENHYGTMTIEELCDLDVVRDKAAKNAHLYMWATSSHLPEAFSVMHAWGFEYKTYLVWVKPQMGMGNYFRVSTEIILFGVKGDMRTRDRGLKNWFEIPRGKHSQKPSAFYDLVMKASPGPFMELFSRCYANEALHCVCSKCRLNWSVWGNQA